MYTNIHEIWNIPYQQIIFILANINHINMIDTQKSISAYHYNNCENKSNNMTIDVSLYVIRNEVLKYSGSISISAFSNSNFVCRARILTLLIISLSIHFLSDITLDSNYLIALIDTKYSISIWAITSSRDWSAHFL